MLDLYRARAAIMRELGWLIARLDAADEAAWNVPVRCEGWRVLELAMHCADARRGMADALRRMAAGVTEQGVKLASPSPERSAVLQALHAGRVELVDAFDSVAPGSLANAFPLVLPYLARTVRPPAFGARDRDASQRPGVGAGRRRTAGT